MDNTAPGKPHSLVLDAAVTLIVVTLLGAVAISGLLPGLPSEKSDPSAPKRQQAAAVTVPAGDSACASCGTVEAVRVIEVRDKGNTAPAIPVAADSALPGYAIEKNVPKRVSYRVTVRMDDGLFRTVAQATAPTVSVGDRVRIANGALAARS